MHAFPFLLGNESKYAHCKIDWSYVLHQYLVEILCCDGLCADNDVLRIEHESFFYDLLEKITECVQ